MTHAQKVQLEMRLHLLRATAEAIDHREGISDAIFDSADRDEARGRVQTVLGVNETETQAVPDHQLFLWRAAEGDRLAGDRRTVPFVQIIRRAPAAGTVFFSGFGAN